ncbi:MAG: AbrB/MazE/SpoVT family DNA-binding domain-containing protein [Desulfobacteraceae bacterium]|nr:MAG: AbrB/MazE/SpoVT family DNA-binding domain-containing protein [Desulfobacteraceae bacterium]
MESYATAKGQIVIPAKIRKKYGIEPGTKIKFIDEGERIVLQPITPEYVRRLRGKYKGKGLLKALCEEKKHEREI